MTEPNLPANIVGPGPTQDSYDNTIKLKPPNGVPKDEWLSIIECAAQNYRLSNGVAAHEKATLKAFDIDSEVSEKTWDLVFDYKFNLDRLHEALSVRGVAPLGRGLTAQQSVVLDLLTDPSHGNVTWKTRLRRAGITEATFASWLSHEPFALQLKTLASHRMNSVQGIVDAALAGKAMDGELDAIKYYDKRVGRDPDKKQEMDGRRAVGIIIDVMTKHLSDQPEIMRKIAAEIEVRMKLDGGLHQ